MGNIFHLQKVAPLANMAIANMATWMLKNRLTYPVFFFRAGIVAVGFLFAALAIHMVSTGVGRIVEDIILQAGAGVGLIAFLSILSTMVWGSIQATSHVWQTWSERKSETADEPKAIPAETRRKWQPLSIAPDTLFFQQNGETMAEFAARVSAFTPTMAEWGILVKRGELQVTVLTPGAGIHFEREDEPFLPMLNESEPRPRGVDHLNESQEDFEKYCYWLSLHLKPWTTIKKYEHAPNEAHKTAVEILKAEAKTVTFVLSLLLFCLPVFGQSKARQVDEVLGTRIREIPEAGEKVTFIFREGSKDKYYERTGDGKSEYTDLLQKTSGLVKYNDQGGELVAIMKNGEAVAKAAHVERVNEVPKQQSPVAPNGAVYLPPNNTADPIRPRGTLQGPDVANTPVTDEPPRFTMPSAEESAIMAEHAKYQIWQYGNMAGTVARPWWDVIMTAFWVVYPILIILSIIAWVCARVFSSEGMIREHRVARRSLVMVLLGVAGVLLINAMLFTISLQPGPFVLTVVGAALAGIAYLIVSRLTPNFDPASGNEPRIESPYGQRRIG